MRSLSFRMVSRARRGVAAQRRDRIIAAIFRMALRAEIAVLLPATKGAPFRAISTERNQLKGGFDADRVVGVYRNTGDPHALLGALMEDLTEVALVGL